MAKIDYENWEEHEEENLQASKEAVMLDIDGHIDLENEGGAEAGEEDLPYRHAAAGMNGQQLYDVTDPGNALLNKDNVPSSGIVLNANYLNALRAARDADADNSLEDSRYPDIVHFRLIDDLQDGSSAVELKEELDDFYEALADLCGEGDLPEDFEVYDGLVGDGTNALALHARIEYGELAEAYLTLESAGAADLMEGSGADSGYDDIMDEDLYDDAEELSGSDFGAGRASAAIADFDDEEVFDAGNPDLIPEDAKVLNAFKAYLDKEDPTNCRTLPASFLASYLKRHDFSSWLDFLREAADDGRADFLRPLPVGR